METIAFHNEEERSHPISTQDTDEEKKVDEAMAIMETISKMGVTK